MHLTFVLGEDATRVTSKLSMVPTHNEAAPPALFLNGRPDIKLVSVKVNGNVHGNELLEQTPKTLTLKVGTSKQQIA